jgi:hypothetical protein
MRRYFSLLLLAGALSAGCTSVDDTLGQTFVPPHQQMELRIDTIGGFDTYIATNDTIPVSGQGRLLLGRRIDPVFGQITGAGMTDFFPATTWNDGNFFGYGAIADSIYLDVQINKITGNAAVEQTFNIYALRDSLRRDTTYFRGADIAGSVDMARPLFSFKLSDEYPQESVVPILLTPTDEGKAFMQRLADRDSTSYADPWPKFHQDFYGLYFAPAPGSPADAATYEIELDNTGLLMYYHNFEKSNPTESDTITYAPFLFTDSWYRYDDEGNGTAININVMDVDFEYPPQMAAALNDTLSTSAALETVYVQGLGGVATCLKVSDEMVDFLANITTNNGVTYSGAAINQARIYFPVVDTSPAALDLAPKRLGMYYTYSQPIIDNTFYTYAQYYGPVPIYDYYYPSEFNTSSQATTKPKPLPYGGYLTRSAGTGYYEMVITNYITQLMLHPDTTPRTLWLGPSVQTRLCDYSQVALRGSGGAGENPIRLVLTYMLLK